MSSIEHLKLLAARLSEIVEIHAQDGKDTSADRKEQERAVHCLQEALSGLSGVVHTSRLAIPESQWRDYWMGVGGSAFFSVSVLISGSQCVEWSLDDGTRMRVVATAPNVVQYQTDSGIWLDCARMVDLLSADQPGSEE